jgi:serine/threonine protein kinase
MIRGAVAMSLLQNCLGLVRKYGVATKVVATGVLNVVAPGSGTLVELAGQAIEAASHASEGLVEEQFRRELLARVSQNDAELARLGQLLEFLAGPLAKVCDKAASFADQPQDLPDIVNRAIAADPSLTQVLHQIGNLKEQFAVFQADIRRLADRQDEAAPVYVRMNRVADYFDELWQAGIPPKEFVRLLQDRTQVVNSIQQGQTAGVDSLIREMGSMLPQSASVPLLEAAVAVREFNYPAAQRELATAVRLKPSDGELLELSRRVTTLATRSTVRQASSTTSAESKRLQPGDTLDGWHLEMRLGAGGWGQVFKASRDGQTKALKVMHPDLATNPAFVERFKKEIATLQRLPRHPNLVRIEDFGFCPEQRTWYLVMEYVDGPTLERYLATKGPLSEPYIHKVFAEVIDGLSQAHAAGIVHRDIKPGNLIFRRSDQRLVFVDFGLAVEVKEIGHTQLGGLSALFAAPEQHYGEPGTQASDVFSMCAVIHYALQYDKPEQRKPNRFSPTQAPESLRELLSRGLAVNISERPADAGQLRQLFTMAQARVAESLPEQVIRAWQQVGAKFGWMGKNQYGNVEFSETKDKLKAPVPAFRFDHDAWEEKTVSMLPAPRKAFGLDLSQTKVTDVGLKHLAGLTNLQSLDLWETYVTDAGLKELAGLTNLQSLDLSDTKVTDAGLKHLVGLKNLQKLNLSRTRVTDAGLKHLAGLTNLQSLNLDNTQVTDAGLKELAGLTSLQSLHLPVTQVTDGGLKVLAGLKNLQSLDFGWTQVTDGGLKVLAGLTSLQSLCLRSTKVTDAGVEQLRRALPKCEIYH